MKILNIHKTITAEDLITILDQKLNPLFHQQKQSNDVSFINENKEGVVEISSLKYMKGFYSGLK